MRPFLILALLLCLVSGSDASRRRALLIEKEVAASGGNPPASPLVNQNFEGTGYDNGETWGENGFGTKDEDYTTTVLLGSQSLFCSIDDSSAGSTFTSFSGGGERWGFCMFRVVTSRNGNFVRLFDSGFANVVMQVKINGTKLRAVCGSVESLDTVASFSTGTTYYLWWRYLKGTGLNGEAEIWFSTTSTKPADGSDNHRKTIVGTATTDAAELAFGSGDNTAGSALDIIYDHTYIDDVVILSNP